MNKVITIRNLTCSQPNYVSKTKNMVIMYFYSKCNHNSPAIKNIKIHYVIFLSITMYDESEREYQLIVFTVILVIYNKLS